MYKNTFKENKKKPRTGKSPLEVKKKHNYKNNNIHMRKMKS